MMDATPQSIFFDLSFDGSTKPIELEYVITKGAAFDLNRMVMRMVGKKLNPTEFGDQAKLTNGVQLRIIGKMNETLLDFTEEPLKMNADFSILQNIGMPFIVTVNKETGFSDFKVQRSFWSIRLSEGQKIQVIVQDDLTSIPEFDVVFQGTLFGDHQ